MFSIQEITSKFSDNLKAVRAHMDAKASFHPSDASIYTGLGPADQQGIRETLKAVPLQQLLEFLGKGTTLGNYMVADKVHDDLISYSLETDITPLISSQIVNGWSGADLLVAIAKRDTYKANEVVSGSASPASTVESTRPHFPQYTSTLTL